MSQLQQLKGSIESVAQQAKSTAGQLQSFQVKFSQSASQVQATIGGSAQAADKNVLAALDDARSKVDAAIAALHTAASVASRYGGSL